MGGAQKVKIIDTNLNSTKDLSFKSYGATAGFKPSKNIGLGLYYLTGSTRDQKSTLTSDSYTTPSRFTYVSLYDLKYSLTHMGTEFKLMLPERFFEIGVKAGYTIVKSTGTVTSIPVSVVEYGGHLGFFSGLNFALGPISLGAEALHMSFTKTFKVTG